MEFINRFKNALFLIVVLLAQAIGLAMQVRTPAQAGEPDRGGVRLIRLWANATVTPLESAVHWVGSGVANAWLNYADLRHVREQNKAMQAEITRMRIDEAAIAEDALEGRRLQSLLAFKQRYVSATEAAQVIGVSPSDQSHLLTIDKGSNDGLKPDMAVITQDGIVGKLRDVFPTTAQVLEINDPMSGAGVILESTRIRGILSGTVTGQVQIGNLTADSRIKPGEQVLTSGGDQVYPRGLPVGTVVSIAPDPDRQPYVDIRIKPAVNLDRVEEVLVITGVQGNLTPSAEQDLDTAVTQHAADISAEKLPGLHDAGPLAANGTPTLGPGSTVVPPLKVPHPLPTLHPDRYTSGSTPPATELTPGARIMAPMTPEQPVSRPKKASEEAPQPMNTTPQ